MSAPPQQRGYLRKAFQYLSGTPRRIRMGERSGSPAHLFQTARLTRQSGDLLIQTTAIHFAIENQCGCARAPAVVF